MVIHSICFCARAKRIVTLTRRFKLPENMREIPSSKLPCIVRPYPFDDASASTSRPASIELEAGLRAIFESSGLSIPNPCDDLAGASLTHSTQFHHVHEHLQLTSPHCQGMSKRCVA